MTEERFRPLEPRERSILDLLLTVEFAGRDDVREQIDNSVARVIDTEGSIELRTSSSRRAQVSQRVPIEAEWNDENGQLVGILLHVVDGFVDELKVVNHAGEPIAGQVTPSEIRIEKSGR